MQKYIYTKNTFYSNISGNLKFLTLLSGCDHRMDDTVLQFNTYQAVRFNFFKHVLHPPTLPYFFPIALMHIYQ